MKPWHLRPREIRNLFNPAFCGLVLVRGIEGFEEEARSEMPFSLTLLILPLCLHKKSRSLLKAGNRSYLTKVLEQHPEMLIGLAERATGLLPYTFEAFGYLQSVGAIRITGAGAIGAVPGTVAKTITGSPETKECQQVARSLGRKFATINDRSTIYTSLGIRP